MNEVYVASIINSEDDFFEVECFSTEEKAIEYFALDLQDHYHYNEDCDYMDKESIDKLIEEMKSEIKKSGSWCDDANNTLYFIERKEVQ